MKLLVRDFPYFDSDCLFYDGKNCKLTGCACDYFQKKCGERDPKDCDCLEELLTEEQK